MEKEKVNVAEVNRAKADFKEFRQHGEHLEHRKIDALPGVIQKSEVEEGKTIADRELERLQKADVFRSNNKTVAEMNSNKNRYKWGPSKEGRKYESK